PLMDWNRLPVTIPTSAIPWPAREKKRAGISAFGFSGTNSHLILEEYVEDIRSNVSRVDEWESHVLTLSAKTPAALRELSDRYSECLGADADFAWGDFCLTANTGRGQFNYRRAVSGRSVGEICAKLGEPFPRQSAGRVKVAFVFERANGHFAEQYELASR